MSKKLGIFMAFLLMVSLILVACSGTQASPTPTTSAPSSSAPPSTTTTATATSGTTAPPPTTSAPSVKPSASSPAATASATSTPGPQQYGGILRIISSSGSPLNLGDPKDMRDFASIMDVIPCLQALVFSDNSGQMQGVLAQSWQLASDQKSITFNLRKGVKFQDGTDFNAQAAKWNLDRRIAANPTALLASTDVLDDYTIRINLKSYQNTLLNDLEGTAGMMVSPTAAQKNGTDWLLTHPVGTGPYKFVSFSKDVSLEYARFDDYWGGKPYLDGVKFIFVIDPTTAQLAFQSGTSDVIATGSDAVTNDLVKKGYKLEKRPGPMMAFIPDSKHASSPFSNIKVRQAIEYAIDRQSIASTFGYGLWEVANQPATMAQFGHIDNSPYTYDVAKAKQLMTDAGYANGFKTSIIASNTSAQDPLVAIQSQLAKIGITVNLNVVDYGAWVNYTVTGWNNALLYTTEGATDINYVAFLYRYFVNPGFTMPVMAVPTGLTDLINKALVTPDMATAKSLSQQAVKMIVDDATTIPLYILPASYVMTDKVHDTYFSNVGGSGFRWSVEKAWLGK